MKDSDNWGPADYAAVGNAVGVEIVLVILIILFALSRF